MNIDIAALLKKHKKQTKADIIDVEEMRVIIPVLLREIAALHKKLSESEKYVITLEAKKPPLERKGELGKAKWDISFDSKKNRLYIGLEGIFNVKSAKIASNTILSLLSQVKKGFDVVNDVRDLEALTDLKVLFHIKKVIFSIKQAGVKRVARISNPDNKIISKLFGEGFKELNTIVIKANSLEEANTLLDNRETFLKQ